MHFHKYPYLTNFEFAKAVKPGKLETSKGKYSLDVQSAEGDIYRLDVAGRGWTANQSQCELAFNPSKAPSLSTRLSFTPNGGFLLEDSTGRELLASLSGRFFAQCGTASIFEFIREKDDQFYGMGEKWTGFEHSGKTTKFWNTDIWGDFHPESFTHGRPAPDPAYVSIPYLILKRRGVYIGLLLDNPEATFISTGFKVSIASQMEVETGGDEFAAEITKDIEAVERRKSRTGFIHFGAESGKPALFVVVGPSLAELTRKLQKLVGTTPRPPAWALGYHQCRWGYESEKDLQGLDSNFRANDIPVDGLWLDIDYMRGYRVFTFDKKHFPNPKSAASKLERSGRKIIPIIDPGVKFEKGYSVYDRGHKANAFCLNPQGREYIGLVWPGETVFPDFSMSTARKWWAQEVADFASHGINGAWLDMNDPSTGPAENMDMLFDNGTKAHPTYHNQYAHGMARATYEGFLTAHPDHRPFLLCRSGSTGSGRYTAIWTGDNYSNYHHLKNCIATTLNLALSGVPFNAPDAGGFGGDTTPELMVDWFKAGFLFPVLRNHTVKNSRRQEPWAFGPKVLKLLRQYIQLRYRLRPYLYQLFIEQERSGDAILRPLFYDFADSARLPLGKVDDQFLVGPWVLQAPFLEEKQASRSVVLPGGVKWFDLSESRWLPGGRKIKALAHTTNTPIYVRDKAILPLARLAPEDNAFRSEQVDFHVFLSSNGETQTRYTFDDGVSFAYRQGVYSEVTVTAKRKGPELSITTTVERAELGKGDFTFTAEKSIQRVTINGKPARKVAAQGVPLGAKPWQTWSA